MNKTIIAGLVLIFAMSGVAFARADEDRDEEKVTSPHAEQAGAPTLMRADNGDDRDDDEATSSDSDRSGKKESKEEEEDHSEADEHRSEVAKFVQTLLSSSSRLGGIGEQVRMVANEQASSTEKVAEAIEKVEKRNKIKTFLIGSDYKNLGEIRSEIVTTANRLERLSRALEGMASSTEKTAIAAEIQSLKDEQAKIETFVKTNESKFSIFGWAVRLFQK